MPGLRFKYGSYTSATGAARPVGLSLATRDVNGFPTTHIWTLTCEVLLLADGPNNVTTAALALSDALRVPYQNGGIQYTLNDTDWYNTHHWLNTSGSLNGVLPAPIGFPPTPLQYATEQTVTVTLTAEYPNTDLARTTLRLEEQVSIRGEGGAITVLRPRWNSTSIYQELKPYSDVYVTQSGIVVGRSGYVSLPSPLIGTAGARNVQVTDDNKRLVQVGVGVIEYQRAYAYQFALASHPGTTNPNGLT